MFPVNLGVHPVPEVGLQADQVTKQVDQINLHQLTLPHVDSMECKILSAGFANPAGQLHGQEAGHEREGGSVGHLVRVWPWNFLAAWSN